MNREFHRWYSPSLGRDMDLLVFGHAGARAIVYPTSGTYTMGPGDLLSGCQSGETLTLSHVETNTVVYNIMF